MDKPTRRQRELLQWWRDQQQEWLSMYPIEFSRRTVALCVERKWLEEGLAGISGIFGWRQWRLTDAGRRALEEADKHAPT